MPNYANTTKIINELESENMRQAGCTEKEIDKRTHDKRYLDSYFFTCNLFKKGTPLTFKEKRSAIRRYVFDDAETRAAIEAEDRSRHNLFLRIYDLAYGFKSPTVMALLFQLQYSLKYNLMPLYLRIAPRLRK